MYGVRQECNLSSKVATFPSYLVNGYLLSLDLLSSGSQYKWPLSGSSSWSCWHDPHTRVSMGLCALTAGGTENKKINK